MIKRTYNPSLVKKKRKFGFFSKNIKFKKNFYKNRKKF
ncbi:50S ribosomal subunit protein L34 [Candidatus Nasuia deltocephalinicola]|nr:50S ribosomal subunit protein L34 [Candidatus Nasuia deltocephalinicola]